MTARIVIPNINYDVLYKLYIVDDKTTKEIAILFECSRDVIYRYLKELKIPRKPLKRNAIITEYKDKEWLINEYEVNGRSSGSIANECGVWTTEITKWLRIHGIHIRTKSENAKNNMAFKGHKHSEVSKEKIRQKMIGRTFSKETLKKRSDALKGRVFSEETINKMRNACVEKRQLEKNGNWHGGISYEPYCPKFNSDLKRRVRAFFNYECILCGKTKEENTKQCRELSVHHVEYNKQACCDGLPVQFALLCNRCHGKMNSNRNRWTNMLHVILYEIYNNKSYFTQEEWISMQTQTTRSD